VTGKWLPDAAGLLLVASLDGRDTVHRLDLASGVITALEAPQGVVDAYSVRDDGTVQALVESSADAPRLVVIGGDPIVEFDGEPPAPSVAAESIHADGPAGSVHAFLHRPVVGQAPYPTVFAVHGGPTAQDVDAYRPLVAALVDAGYAVVRVNYRGSTGYGRGWRDALVGRLGAIELEDIGAVRAQLEVDGIVDADRVAMVGGSWGGFMTLFALGVEPEAWSAGVALVPLADFAISQEDQPAFMTAYDHVLFGGTLDEMPDEYRAASPLTYVDAVRSPVLITAGANDPRCPPRATDTYVERLRARDHDVVYIRKDTGHASYDNERLVEEIGLALDFLGSRMPAR
jgi:dipeptidyl aminopeptidase/acylaminoacyl peptidase